MDQLLITWHGHSCFTVEYGGYSIVLDPYADKSVDGLPPLRLAANEVLCSHDHSDHNAREVVQLSQAGKPSPFAVTALSGYHDDAQGEKRGPNTMRILAAGGLRIAHLGDVGCMPSEAQLRALTDLDAVLIPVGGYFTIDAAQAKVLVERLHPRVVIPMHYRRENFGYPVIGTLEEYLKLVDNAVFYPNDTLTLTAETPAQTAILRFPLC